MVLFSVIHSELSLKCWLLRFDHSVTTVRVKHVKGCINIEVNGSCKLQATYLKNEWTNFFFWQKVSIVFTTSAQLFAIQSSLWCICKANWFVDRWRHWKHIRLNPVCSMYLQKQALTCIAPTGQVTTSTWASGCRVGTLQAIKSHTQKLGPN